MAGLESMFPWKRQTGGRFARGNDPDHGGHTGGPVRIKAGRHSAASGQKKVTRARGCDRCVVFHHCRRHCASHCDARESKTDFQRSAQSSSGQPRDSAVTRFARNARNESQAVPLSLGSDVPPTP